MGRCEIMTNSSLSNNKLKLLNALKGGNKRVSINSLPERPSNFEHIPLSSEQKRMWIFWEDDPQSTVFHLMDFFKISGDINLEKLEEAVSATASSFEAFKMNFVKNNDNPEIRLSTEGKVTFSVIKPSTNINSLVLCKNLCEEPFDLEAGPLARVILVNDGSKGFTMGISFHHIISDGWSINIFLEEIMKYYYGLNTGAKPNRNFVDYLFYKQNESYKEALNKDMEYWESKLVEPINPIRFPGLLHNTGTLSFKSRLNSLKLSPEANVKINNFCKEHAITPYQYFLAAFYIMYHKFTGSEKICVGTPTAGRLFPELEREVGYFTNTLPIVIEGNKDIEVKDLLHSVKDTCLTVFRHQNAGLNEIIANRKAFFNDRNYELFNGLFSFNNFPEVKTKNLEFDITPLKNKAEESQVDFTLSISEKSTEYYIDFHYRQDFLEEESAHYILNTFEKVLMEMMESLDTSIGEVKIFNTSQLEEVVNKIHIHPHSERPLIPVQRLFERQAEKTPLATAVVHNNQSITYEELNEKASGISALLLERKFQKEEVCAVYMDRGVNFIASIYGILKARGKFVLIDPKYPIERVRMMLEISGAKTILTSDCYENLCLNTFDEKQVLNLDTVNFLDYKYDQYLVSNYQLEENMGAYIIFTSGTTGAPKGIHGTHLGLLNHNYDTVEEFNLTSSDTSIHFSALGFDATLEEIMPVLTIGGTVIVRNEEAMESFVDFNSFIEDHKISVIGIPAAYWEKWVIFLTSENIDLPNCIRIITLSGQRISPKVLGLWNKLTSGESPELINTYGPSEVSITTTTSTYKGEKNSIIDREFSMGHAWRNYKLRVLDDKLEDVGPLSIGELYIGGIGVTFGYYNNVDLTEKSFIYLTDETGKKEKYFKTGDHVSMLPDGNLVFIGRKDSQVKIRGNRVEIGEIKNVLDRHDDVIESVVTVEKDAFDENFIIAYVKGDFPQNNLSHLKFHLESYLPSFMVPKFFVAIEEVPLTVNGKVDYQKLSTIDRENEPITISEKPGTILEKELLTIFQDILNNNAIGIDSNFFEYGGDSLKSINLISKINTKYGIKLKISEVFTSPSVRTLALKLEAADVVHNFNKNNTIIPYDLKEVRMTPIQKQIYVVQSKDKQNTSYNMPMSQILYKKLDKVKMEESVNELVQANEILRTIFTEENGEFVQKVKENIQITIEEYNCEATKVNEMLKNLIQPFNLEKGPLFRCALINLENERQAIFFDFHHIICDGTSLVTFFKNLFERYNGGVIEVPNVQYKDYAHWLNQELEKGSFRNQELFWKEYVSKEYFELDLPIERNRSITKQSIGKTLEFSIDKKAVNRIKNFLNLPAITDHFILFATFSAVINRLSNSEKFFIGSLISGRDDDQIENMIGLFMNYLPIKLDFNEKLSFKDLIINTTNDLLMCYENHNVPFSHIVEQSEWSGEFNRNPLFDTMFIFHNEVPPAQMSSELFQGEELSIEHGNNKLDLKVDVFPREEQFKFLVEYDSALFSEHTLQVFVDLYHNFLNVEEAELDVALARVAPLSTENSLLLSSKRKANMVEVPVYISSSFTFDNVADSISFWSKNFAVNPNITFGPYNQVFQELYDSESSMNQNDGVTFVCQRAEDWIRDLDDEKEQLEIIKSLGQKYIEAIKSAKPKGKLNVVLLPISNYELSEDLINEINHIYGTICDQLKELPSVRILDLTKIENEYEILDMFDETTDDIAHIPYTDTAFTSIGMCLAREIVSFYQKKFKVIAVDCDNTLWNGVCGEDGPTGVKIEDSHRHLQQFLLDLKNKGFLLVLCTKNNEKDVLDTFKQNREMVLKQEDFVAWRINWSRKSDNLLSMAKELNLGIDSFIFLDDSHMECLEVMNNLPSVHTIQVPEPHSLIVPLLKNSWAFDIQLSVSNEGNRSELYRAEKERKKVYESKESTEDFLKLLNLEMSFHKMKPEELARVSQLTYRTNQFNLTTMRRSEAEILKLNHENIRVIKLRDKFGDYGLVGVVFFEVKEDELFIDTFLLSCRALGRNVEFAAMECLKKLAKELKLKRVSGKFIPTEKNKPIQSFLNQLTDLQQDGSFLLDAEENLSSNFINVFYEQDFPEEVKNENKTNQFMYNHIGISVWNIESKIMEFESIGYKCIKKVYDPIQKAELALLEHKSAPTLELISSTGPDSRVNSFLESRGESPYHICFEINNLNEIPTILKENNLTQIEEVTKPEPAILFDNARVQFYSVPGFGLIEFLEVGSVQQNVSKEKAMLLLSTADPNVLSQFLLALGGKEQRNATGAFKSLIIKKYSFEIISKKNVKGNNFGNIHVISPSFHLGNFETNTVSKEMIGLHASSSQYKFYNNWDYLGYEFEKDVDLLRLSDWEINIPKFESLLHRKYYLPLIYSNNRLQHEFFSQSILNKKSRGNTQLRKPENSIQEKLLEIWKEELLVNEMSIDDSFFDLGGHSLKAVSLLKGINDKMNSSLLLSDIFRLKTIEMISKEIESKELEVISSEPIQENIWYQTSTSQKRMYLLHSMEPESLAYNLPVIIKFEGDFNREKFEKSLSFIANNNSVFRTIFKSDNHSVQQKVIEHVSVPIQILEKRKDINSSFKEFIKPFNLEEGPLIRVGHLKDSDVNYVIFDFHHIVMDGLSIVSFLEDLYQHYYSGDYEKQKYEYIHYALLENQYLTEGKFEDAKSFWNSKFQNGVVKLDLPYDYKRPQESSYKGSSIKDNFLYKREDVSELCRKLEITPYTFFLTGFYILLNKYSNSKEVIVGSPFSNRLRAEFSDLYGVFINTLPLNYSLDARKNVKDTLKEVFSEIEKVLEHQHFPYELILEELNVDRALNRNPLFDILFSFNDFDNQGLDDKVKGYSIMDNGDNTTLMDLELVVMPNDEFYQLKFIYSTDLFKENTITRMIDHYKTILNFMMNNCQESLSNLSITSAIEERQLEQFTDHHLQLPEYTVPEIVMQQAEKNPLKPAIVFEDETWSYEKLYHMSNRIAISLREANMPKESIVAIMMDRSPWMVASILGAWSAGLAYLPIELDIPSDRMNDILKRANCGTILTVSNDDTPLEVKDINANVIKVDEIPVKDLEKERFNMDIDSRQLAYVIFTSGSTGKPKGAMVEHLGMLNHIMAKIELLSCNEDSVVVQNASHCFDISVFQFFMALCTGGTTRIIKKSEQQNLKYFINVLNNEKVTHLEVVPSYLNILADYLNEFDLKLNDLRFLLVTGEPVKTATLTKWFEHHTIPVVNAYGPTEASDDIAHHIMYEAPKEDPVPIGKPIVNSSLYILDEELQKRPVGLKGEIYVAGICVGKGYINDQAKTEVSFIQNPYSKSSHDRVLYKTGDIGRWREDGTIEFFGRKDYQIKIRGYRIELGEIEHTLSEHPLVSDAVVKVQSINNEQLLVGYVQSKHADTLELKRDIQRFLNEKLPYYMVPDFLEVLQKLPLNSNGKVDRHSLQEVTINSSKEELVTENEKKVAQLVRKILKLEDMMIYRSDNVFSLGANSLTIISLIANLERETGRLLTFREIVLEPTIMGIAKSLKTDNSDVVPVTTFNITDEYNLFSFPPIAGWGLIYNDIPKYMKSGNLHLFDFIEDQDRIEKYAEYIYNMSNQKEWILMGYSAGGNLALEVAAYLERVYSSNGKVIMFDSRTQIQHQTSEDEIIKEVNEDINNGLNQVSELANWINDNPNMIDVAYNKRLAFANYFYNEQNMRSIYSEVYWVSQDSYDESAEKEKVIAQWKDILGKDTLNINQGFGSHSDMFFEPYMKDNINLLLNIIKSSKKSLLV